jgi:hypothetical protein
MKMECNIDQRGRTARIITGAISDLAGSVCLVLGILNDSLTLIIVGGVLIVAGCFMIFEGLKGWCLARALGMKTPM